MIYMEIPQWRWSSEQVLYLFLQLSGARKTKCLRNLAGTMKYLSGVYWRHRRETSKTKTTEGRGGAFRRVGGGV